MNDHDESGDADLERRLKAIREGVMEQVKAIMEETLQPIALKVASHEQRIAQLQLELDALKGRDPEQN